MHSKKSVTFVVCVLALISFAQAIKPTQLAVAMETCNNQTKVLSLCTIDPLNKEAYGKYGEDVLQCANDYSKSWICFSNFGACTKGMKQLQTDIPVHCWNCLVDSPAESQLYKQYQDCLIKNYAYHTMGFFLVMLLVLAFIIA